VSEKSLEMSHFRVSTYPKEPFLGRAGGALDETVKDTAATDVGARTMEPGQETILEIPVERFAPPQSYEQAEPGAKGAIKVSCPILHGAERWYTAKQEVHHDP
jgi:hypothetical protein